MPRGTAPAFNEVIHSPTRLRICSLLRTAELEFGVLKEILAISDAALSKNLKVLSDAGYVEIRKDRSPDRHDRRQITWASLTKDGRKAVQAHLAALEEIICSGADGAH